MLENINEIESRNKQILTMLLEKYEISKTIRELEDTESIFVSVEWENKDPLFGTSILKRVILYANVKLELENDKIIKVNKKEILYNFGKKKIKQLKDKEIDLQILELNMIIFLVRQLKSINKLKYEECKIEAMMIEKADLNI